MLRLPLAMMILSFSNFHPPAEDKDFRIGAQNRNKKHAMNWTLNYDVQLYSRIKAKKKSTDIYQVL